MVERAKNKYSKESSRSCRKYEIAKKWRGTISHRKIFRRALCFHILRGTRENLFPLRRNKWRRKRRERDREENLLDSRAVAYTKAFREVHPTGANSRGWAKAFLERKSSRCEKSVAKIEPRRRTALLTLLSIVSFFFFLLFFSLHPSRFLRDTRKRPSICCEIIYARIIPTPLFRVGVASKNFYR